MDASKQVSFVCNDDIEHAIMKLTDCEIKALITKLKH